MYVQIEHCEDRVADVTAVVNVVVFVVVYFVVVVVVVILATFKIVVMVNQITMLDYLGPLRRCI